jgi:hypothetical protein
VNVTVHSIRHFEAGDLPGVVALMRAHLPPPIHDEAFLAASLLESPDADPELASLVAVDASGDVVGFLAGPVRRLILDGRPLRAVCCSHFVVSERARMAATGVQLLRGLLAGPQELTFTDSANPAASTLWQALGGQLDHSRSLDWMLVLRPGRLLGSVAGAALRRRPLRPLMPVDAIPAHVAGRRLLPRAFPAPEPNVESVPADATAIVAALPDISRRMRLRGDPSVDYLERAFDYLREGQELVTRIVRQAGRPIGWYAYLPRPGAVGRAIHIAADQRRIDAVVGEMLGDARDRGCAAMSGRLDPHLEDPLRTRMAAVGFARRTLLQCRDPEVAAILASSSSLLTQLDGEWHLV